MGVGGGTWTIRSQTQSLVTIWHEKKATRSGVGLFVTQTASGSLAGQGGGVPASGGTSKVMGTFSSALTSNIHSARPTELPVSGKPGFGRSHARFLLTPSQMGIISPCKDDPTLGVV